MAATLSTARMVLAGLTLALAVVAGGSSQADMISTAVAEVGALPLLGVGLWMLLWRPTPVLRWPLLILGAGVLAIAATLIPLPAETWRGLPGRAAAWSALASVGARPTALPLSLNPGGAARSLASTLPAIAVFLSVAGLDWRRRERLVWVFAGLALVSALVGLAQFTGRLHSFYTVTNPGSAVGFFANRNHLAALLCAGLPLAAGLAAIAHRRRYIPGAQRAVVSAATAAGACLIGAVATGSRAGLLLTIAALVGSAAMLVGGAVRSGTIRSGVGAWRPAVLAVAAVGLMVVLQFTRLSAFDTPKPGAMDEGRGVVTATTLAAAKAFAPLGAGLGTFPSVYAAVEPPDTLTSEYFNHAHNDWAELWLEGGLPAALMVLAFVGWFGATAWRVWRGPGEAGAPEVLLPRAASLSVALLLIHSSADYPLRTIADMTVFAFACALLVRPSASPAAEPEADRIDRIGEAGRVRPISVAGAGFR